MPRTALIYGESGTFKSSQLGEIAEYLYWRYGGISRLVTADSGVSPMQEQIDRGVIHYWDITTAKHPMGLLRKVINGYWPDRLVNGVADETSFRLTTGEEWAKISGFFIEGVTRIADVMMQDLKEKRRDTGEPLQAKFEDAGVQFAQASRGTYGFVQDYSKDYIGDLKQISVPWVIMTGHEGKGEDLVTKKTIFGPAIIGKAGTDKVCGWFENSIHTESYRYVTKGKDGKPQPEKQGVRGVFIRHSDIEVPNVYWPAKLGVTPKIMARINKRFPNGYVPFKMDEEGNYVSGVHTLIEAIDDAAGINRPGEEVEMEVRQGPPIEGESIIDPAAPVTDEVSQEGVQEASQEALKPLEAPQPAPELQKASTKAVGAGMGIKSTKVQGNRIPVGGKR